MELGVGEFIVPLTICLLTHCVSAEVDYREVKSDVSSILKR